jgi:hypothetical protein
LHLFACEPLHLHALNKVARWWLASVHRDSHAPVQGWNMALKDASLEFPQRAEDIDALIYQRINGKLKVHLLLPCLHKPSPATSLEPSLEPLKL